jgi:hypothetical protein
MLNIKGGDSLNQQGDCQPLNKDEEFGYLVNIYWTNILKNA